MLSRPVSSRSKPARLLSNHTSELGGAEFVLLDIARHYGPRCHVGELGDVSELQHLADELGVSDRVHWLGHGT